MRAAYLFLILATCVLFSEGQTTPVELKNGDKAPAFVLNMKQGGIQGYSMPYLNRIVLLHFWSSSVKKSRASHKSMMRMFNKYKSALYRNADGFDIIAIAVQSDKTAWNEAIEEDSLDVVNGIAPRSYNDEVCRKYGINVLPTDVLIDEKGNVIAVNPSLRDLEYILDERKSFQVLRKNITGTIAETDNSTSFLRGGNLFLLNSYGDSIARTGVSPAGVFTINEIKLSQDFVLKVETDLNPSQNMDFSIYTERGEKVVTASPKMGELMYRIPVSLMEKLQEYDGENPTNGGIEQIEVIKALQFKPNGLGLLPKDEKEMEAIVSMMQKNKALSVDVIAHVNTKTDAAQANNLTKNQAATVRTFLMSKGIAATRIRTSFKGNTQPREKCAPCNEEQLKKNSRVEFRLVKG
jgi:outer membrane protein OmpA-like peptidoglycan-associated protein